jgi:uncharacterized cupin superfamily protein
MTETTDSGPGPAIDALTLEPRIGAPYPAPYDVPCALREKRALGDAFGLNNFGVNLVRLPPGCASSQRHWHSRQDELIYVLEGEPTLVTDAGEQRLTPGMTAGFRAGVADGHVLVNRTPRDAVYLEVGDRTLVAYFQNQSSEPIALAPGQQVFCAWDRDSAVVFV